MRQVIAALFSLLVLASPAWADPRTDVLSAAARCNAISDYRTWLDCYYGAAQPLRSLLGLAPATPGQVRLVPPPVPGAALASAARPAPMPRPALGAALGGDEDYSPRQPMASYRFDGQRRFTVTLADGTVWQQIQADSIKARWQAPAQTYTATVVPGMFGSHLMRVSDGHSYRVRKPRDR